MQFLSWIQCVWGNLNPFLGLDLFGFDFSIRRFDYYEVIRTFFIETKLYIFNDFLGENFFPLLIFTEIFSSLDDD